jgi:hypothetical protein
VYKTTFLDKIYSGPKSEHWKALNRLEQQVLADVFILAIIRASAELSIE